MRQIEGKVIEISQLQEIFQEKIIEQSAQIEGINETAVGTVENVKEGNEQIREAIKNSATFRVWILFFLVMCTLSLLFLDWYNSWWIGFRYGNLKLFHVSFLVLEWLNFANGVNTIERRHIEAADEKCYVDIVHGEIGTGLHINDELNWIKLIV